MKTLRLPFLGDSGIPLVPVLILLIIPLFSSLILGYQFSAKQITHVPTAIVDSDNTVLSRSLVRFLESNDIFDVRFAPENENDIEALIEQGSVTAALIIPKKFSQDLLEGKSPRVMVIYDGTQMSMAGAAKGRISEVLATIKTGYLLQLMEGKLGVMPAVSNANIQPMSFGTRYLGNPTKNTPNGILEGLLFNISQIAMAFLGVEISENNRRYRKLCKKNLISGAIGLLTVLIVIMTQAGFFGMPFHGTVLGAILITVPFTIGMTSVGVFFRLLTGNRKSAIGLCGILSATLLLAGYTFPVFAMPDILQPFMPFMPFYHFGLPMRDISLIGRTVAQLIPDIIWLFAFVLIFQVLNFALFRLKEQSMKKHEPIAREVP